MSECLRISELVDRLGRLAHGLQYASGLNPAQWEALRFIARANRFSRTPGAIACYMGTTRGTVSQTLISLEAKGCILRKRSPDDRRTVALELTQAGRELIEEDPLCLVLRAAGSLSREEQGRLADGLEGLVRAVQEAKGIPEFGPCLLCAHFRPAPAAPDREGEAEEECRCALNDAALAPEETGMLCVEFEAATRA